MALHTIGTPEQLRDPNYTPPLTQAIPLGIQHVLAMFVSNVTPAIIVAGAAGFGFGSNSPDFPELIYLIQMAMFFAGIATLIQTIGLGPVGARLPIVQGTSFAFLPIMIPLVAGKGVDAFARHQRDHDRQEGETGSLDDRQARADRAQADGLDQRCDAGKEHRHLDQVDQFGKVRRVGAEAEPGRARHDDGRRHVGDEHRQHMLDAQRNRLRQRRRVVRVPKLFGRADGVEGHGIAPLLSALSASRSGLPAGSARVSRTSVLADSLLRRPGRGPRTGRAEPAASAPRARCRRGS